MIVNLNTSECLICLEKCKNTVTFECCGEYLIHKECYTKWKKTNTICLICRNTVVENDTFRLYYITLARIKILVSCYCFIMCLSFLYIIIVCDFSKDYCDLI
jgi:hypothetical protein